MTHKIEVKEANDILIKAVRNYHADYLVDDNGEITDSGKIKRYAIEIQNESGDVIEYTSASSEIEANNIIDTINNL